jgi:hypothetical protein
MSTQKIDLNKQAEVVQGFKLLKATHDYRFGECKILQNETTGQRLILKEKVCGFKQEA